jgi:ParB-like chromosome segregation protein Spo0J
MAKKKYIPSPDFWKESYSRPEFLGRWMIESKVPISKIRIDRNLFAFQNEIDLSQVEFIVENFNKDFWIPILVNPGYYLLDGQHRLRVAKKMGLEFIDVAIDNNP